MLLVASVGVIVAILVETWADVNGTLNNRISAVKSAFKRIGGSQTRSSEGNVIVCWEIMIYQL